MLTHVQYCILSPMRLPWIFTSIVKGVYLVMSAAFLHECAYAQMWLSSLVSVVTALSRYAAVRLSASLGASRGEESPKAPALPWAIYLFISHPASTSPPRAPPFALFTHDTLNQEEINADDAFTVSLSPSFRGWILRWQQHWGNSWCKAFSKAGGCLRTECVCLHVCDCT